MDDPYTSKKFILKYLFLLLNFTQLKIPLEFQKCKYAEAATGGAR